MSKLDEEFYTARGYEITAREGSLTPSMEDYLEMIYRLSQENGYTRVNDLAESLNVQPPSVTKMIQKLSDRAFLQYEKYGMIHLTDEGKQAGRYFLDRHNTLREFLQLIQATDDLQKDVETIEHYITFNTFKVISALVSFFHEYQDILEQFHTYLETNLLNRKL